MTIKRTWTATDACNNVSSALQTIIVRDITPPVLSAPADRTLECPADTRPEATGVATAQDTCGSVSVSHSDEVIDQCGDSMTIKRTWTATDACNNVSSALQTIIVRDITPPVLSAPADRTLECPADTRPDATGVATAQDACGSVSVSHSDEVIDQCGDSMTIKRTWTATDACNNVSSALQTIIVRDITPPVLSAPADRTLECPADTRPDATGVATAQDACGSVSVSHSDEVIDQCGDSMTIKRTWTATDACNNVSSALQTIIVRDITPPVLSAPADRTLECPADTQPDATGVATAQDACGSVTVSHTDTVTTTCGASKVIRRTWTATDSCGNSASGVQTITVRDTTPPALRLPANVSARMPRRHAHECDRCGHRLRRLRLRHCQLQRCGQQQLRSHQDRPAHLDRHRPVRQHL